MYGRKTRGELKQSELEEARLGFVQFLRRKRFSPQFIESHGEDLFATAALEYSRKVAAGAEIESATGWLITCAWRRTMSLLESQARSPQVIATERAEAIEDEGGRGPEQAALDEDRFRRVHEAVAQLPREEQRLLELAYFEEMPVREAARQLDWHPSKAQRRHEAARQRLLELLGVESLDELEIEVGLAAFVSVVGGGSGSLHLPEPLAALGESVSDRIAYVWGRAHELARRLPLGGGGGEPSAVALGGAGRAAGICATAAAACLASGVVGPGLGGVNLLQGKAPTPRKHKHVEAASRLADSGSRGLPASTPSTPTSPLQSRTAAGGGSARPRAGREGRSQRATQAVQSQSLESAAPEPNPEPAGAEPVAATASVPETSESVASGPGPTRVAYEQFGP